MLAKLLHEVLAPTPRQLRQFTWIAPFGFGVCALALHLRHASTPLVLGCLALGILICLLGLASPALVKPVFVGLMLVALPIGIVLSTLALVLIWLLLFTPVALWFRITGRDRLQRRFEPAAETYWRARTRQRLPSSYLRLY